MSSFPSPTIKRHSERARTERDDLDAILDAGCVGTLATVADGLPLVVPLLYGRDGDRLLVHGSTGAGALRAAAGGSQVTFCVVHLDGLVVADNLFDSSANYRSAVIHGVMRALPAEEAAVALLALSDRLLPGRSREVRGSTRKELAATMVLELPIAEGSWAAKTRNGPPSSGDAGPGGPMESDGPRWAGVVPLGLVAGRPEPAPWVPSGTPLPPSVRRLLG